MTLNFSKRYPSQMIELGKVAYTGGNNYNCATIKVIITDGTDKIRGEAVCLDGEWMVVTTNRIYKSFCEELAANGVNTKALPKNMRFRVTKIKTIETLKEAIDAAKAAFEKRISEIK